MQNDIGTKSRLVHLWRLLFLENKGSEGPAEKPSEFRHNEVTWARQDLDKNSFESKDQNFGFVLQKVEQVSVIAMGRFAFE
jgi:hypothetical protein